MTTQIDQFADLRAMVQALRQRPWSKDMGVTCDGVVRTCVFTHEDHAFIIAIVNALPALLAAADRLAEVEKERDVALRLMSQYARQAGEATGKLEMSEAAGIVDGWREKCEGLERQLAEARVEPEPFGYERGEPWPNKPTARALAEAISELAINDPSGLIQRVHGLILRYYGANATGASKP